MKVIPYDKIRAFLYDPKLDKMTYGDIDKFLDKEAVEYEGYCIKDGVELYRKKGAKNEDKK